MLNKICTRSKCSREARPGYKLCDYHVEHLKLYMRERALKLMAKNLCSSCGKSTVTNRRTCEHCRKHAYKIIKKRRKTYTRLGLCDQCGLPLDVPTAKRKRHTFCCYKVR